MKKKNIGIQEFLIRQMVFIAFVSFGLLLLIWVSNEYFVFSSESKLLRKEYESSQKAMLRSEVNNVVDYIEYMKAQTEIRLNSELQGRVYEAIAIATNIYQENVASKSPDEIKKMVKDALRPIRFLKGRGYYFAFSMDGVETLFADRPEMEGVNMLPVQGAMGEYVVKDMIDIIKKHQEGFYQYTWTKPFYKGKKFLKLAYAKYFKPFDWAIGTGEYLDDFTNQIQDTLLERIVNLRFSDEGYFFGSVDGGYPLFTNGKITKGTDHIWDLTDPNGIKIIQVQQKVSKNPEGGFVKYVWHKLGSPNPSPKISFVREIPDWGWVIGAGVYLDTIEKVIAKNEDTLKRELVKKLITSICVFIGLIVLIWFWAKHEGGKTRKSIKAFESSFKKATTESVNIPIDDMQFRELSRIAESANRMIDAQRHSESALRESEERFRVLAEMLPEAIFETDANMNLTYANRQAFILCGYSREDFEKGLNSLDMLVPGDRKRAQENIAKRFQGRGIGMNEYLGLRKDGSTFPLLLHASPIINQGAVEGLRGIIIDITDRKRAEEALIKERDLIELIMGTSPAGIVRVNADGVVVYANKFAEKLLGIELQGTKRRTYNDPVWKITDFAGKPFPEEKLPFIIVKQTGTTVFNVQHAIEWPDGRRILLSINAAPLINSQGQFDGMVSIIEDITERKQAEEALRNSEQFLTETGNIAKIGGWEHDLVTGEVYWTRETYKIVEIESGPIPGPDEHLSYYPLRDRENLEKAYSLSIETGEQFDLELQATTAKGRSIWVRVVGRPEYRDGNCVKIKGIIQDITDQKKVEGQLHQVQKLESIGNLAGGIAHDFNNILSSIIGFTELALDDVTKGTPLEDNLQEVYAAGKRARDLVKQILAFARQSNEERKSIQVDTIVKEVMKLIRSTIPTTVEIKQNIKSKSLIMGNPTQIHQLFMNLCTNAAQAMEDTGGILEVGLKDVDLNEKSSMKLSDLKPGEYVKATISDTGPGIAPDIIGSIFEPYFTTKGAGEGTGMGLALAYGIVESYGGKITVDSKLGQVTVFSIFLPLAKKREDQRPYEKEELPSGTERILFIDDELPIAKMGSQILERLGYRVIVRTSSVEALELFKSKTNDFDLVITDMTMPNMTGDQLAVELMQIRPDIPVVLCTGYSKKISDEMASKIGIKAFAYKPVVKAALAKTVRKVLDEAKSSAHA